MKRPGTMPERRRMALTDPDGEFVDMGTVNLQELAPVIEVEEGDFPPEDVAHLAFQVTDSQRNRWIGVVQEQLGPDSYTVVVDGETETWRFGKDADTALREQRSSVSLL